MHTTLHTYITYFDDRQIEEYGLKQDDNTTLFKGNDTSYEGESINYLNTFYCELCTMYYVWKNNLYSDYVVFKQYRRPFNWEQLKGLPCPGEVITYEKTYLYNPLFIHYAICHGKKRAQDMMNLLHIEDAECYNYWKESKYMYTNNSMVLNWSDFTKLCEYVFGMIDKIDKFYKLDYKPSRYAANGRQYTEDGRIDYQMHWMAYIGERLVSYYIFKNLKARTIPRLTENNGFFKPYEGK